MEAILRSRYVKDAVVILVTLGVFALIVFIYIKVRPTVYLPALGKYTKCPTRWVYDADLKECFPLYPTKCNPFDPDGMSSAEKCDVASTCGTTWKGLCESL
jgi:hypothetical protein